jgi:Ca2+-binding RTX toxin-like protein
MLTTMALGVLMVSSVALALNKIQCTGDPSVLCQGTDGADVMSGTANSDTMIGHAGNDKLNGYGARDALYGGLGNDTLNGGDGNDLLEDGQGRNTLHAGADADEIWVNGGGSEISRVSGGSGNDVVNSIDNAKDTINCGPGIDTVSHYDLDLDTLRYCELDANGPLP